MMFVFTFLQVVALLGSSYCLFRKIVPLIDDKMENCASSEEDAEVWDTSELDVIAESDTEVYFNGSAKFLKKVGEKLPLRCFAEKLQRDGKWAIEAIDLKRPDFCASLHDPKEIWFAKTDKYKCPLEPGVRIQNFVN